MGLVYGKPVEHVTVVVTTRTVDRDEFYWTQILVVDWVSFKPWFIVSPVQIHVWFTVTSRRRLLDLVLAKLVVNSRGREV